MLNHHFIWFLFCFGFAQILAKMRLFVSSCREGLRLSFLLVLGDRFCSQGNQRGEVGFLFPWGVGGPWASVPSGLGRPQACPARPPEALAPGLEGRWPPASKRRSLGLGAGKDSLVLFFGENVEFHARCFMYYIYNINISK